MQKRFLKRRTEKKTISLSHFHFLVGQIAKQKNKVFHRVTCEMRTNHGTQSINFEAYLDCIPIFEGKSPHECIDKVNEYFNSKPAEQVEIPDVTIDEIDLPS